MGELYLADYIDKKIKIITKQGKIFEGHAISYSNGIENEKNCDSIGIEYPTYIVEIFDDEIKSIEILEQA